MSYSTKKSVKENQEKESSMGDKIAGEAQRGGKPTKKRKESNKSIQWERSKAEYKSRRGLRGWRLLATRGERGGAIFPG